tara:strand:+ start:702 stop:1079 length:378 start_codon:yes stop_codon:yes gene_type:complete
LASIDFKNASFVKLKETNLTEAKELVLPILLDGEEIFNAFRGIRDYVLFTDKRIISVNVQGVTGTKKDFTSLPYSHIQSFSVETAGKLDLDSELTLYFSFGTVKFEFKSSFDIKSFSKFIGNYIL